MRTSLKEWAALPASEFADWLIKYHGAHESSRSTLISNLQSQYDRCNLEGQAKQALEHPQVTVQFSLLSLFSRRNERAK